MLLAWSGQIALQCLYTYYSVSMPQDHQEYLKLKPWNLKMVSCFMLLFHFLRNVSDYDLEVNICMFVALVELSDFDAEVLVEGPISIVAIEGKCCIDIFFFRLGYVKLNI